MFSVIHIQKILTRSILVSFVQFHLCIRKCNKIDLETIFRKIHGRYGNYPKNVNKTYT